MVLKNCVCLVSTPGTWNDKFKDDLLNQFISFLAKHQITGKYIDCVPGWACQSQDWFEFTTDIVPNYGWASISGISEEKWKPWATQLKDGYLIMQLNLIKGDKLTPYQ